MFDSLMKSLQSWSDSTKDRQKLQQTYIASAVLLVLFAGVVGLFNYNTGQQLLLVALGAALIYLINAVVWALANAAIFERVAPAPRATITKAKSASATKSTKRRK